MAIYLDNAATTPPDPRVVTAVRRVLEGEMGNASSIHAWGVRAATEIERARQILVDRTGGGDGRLVFTSGATEANNHVIQGMARAAAPGRRRILVSAVEHPSVWETAWSLDRAGFTVESLPVDGEGMLDPDDLARRLGDDVLLVSVMQANHEVGTVQPIRDLGALCHRAGVPFHVDAAQGFTKEPLHVDDDHVDLLTLNAHKLHGPTGVGALWIRSGVPLGPLLLGGGQESGLRPGTVNTAGVAGFGAAASAASADDILRMTTLRDRLLGRILGGIEGSRLHGSRRRLCSNVNVGIEGIPGKRLFQELGRRGIVCSTGSACSSGSLAPSRILLALGLRPDRAHEALRLSLGRFTTEADVDQAADALGEIVAEIRRTP